MKLFLYDYSFSWLPVAYSYNSSYLGDWDQEDHGSRPAQANNSLDPHLQNNQSKMDWRCGSSSSMPALQAWSPKFKTQFHKKQMYIYIQL
jgi:hypothetical protein